MMRDDLLSAIQAWHEAQDALAEARAIRQVAFLMVGALVALAYIAFNV